MKRDPNKPSFNQMSVLYQLVGNASRKPRFAFRGWQICLRSMQRQGWINAAGEATERGIAIYHKYKGINSDR